jgi:S1-C subfamily serine protease
LYPLAPHWAVDLGYRYSRIAEDSTLSAILGLAIDDQIGPMLSSLRVPSGVIVAARTQDPHAPDVALSAGDVIHTVNGLAISTLSDLRAALDALKPHSPVVLQVEREGVLTFVAFELD